MTIRKNKALPKKKEKQTTVMEITVPAQDRKSAKALILKYSKENLSFKKYPPPSEHPIFVKKWNSYIKNISSRNNFGEEHLNQLEILCNYYVDYEELTDYLRRNGYSYLSKTAMGQMKKPFPEVAARSAASSEIRNTLKALGLTISKDTGAGNLPREEEDSWE